MKMQIPHVKAYKVKGRTYCYHRPTGTRIKAEPGTVAFVQEVERLNSQAKADTLPGSLGALMAAYRASPEFAGLAASTREDYGKVMDWLKPYALTPLADIGTPAVMELRDHAFKARKRRFANYVVQVLSLLFNWGRPRGATNSNPAADVPKIRKPRTEAEVNRPWKPQELEVVLAALPPELRPALLLGAYAGLREQDVISVTWAKFDGTAIEARQLKTGDPIWVPAHRALRDGLQAERVRRGAPPDKDTTIVVGHRGGAFTSAGFRARFFKVIRDLRAKGAVADGLTFHGLRHTAATMLADAGCDTRDIQAITGHRTTAMAEKYARKADQKRRASAAIVKLEAFTAERPGNETV